MYSAFGTSGYMLLAGNRPAGLCERIGDETKFLSAVSVIGVEAP